MKSVKHYIDMIKWRICSDEERIKLCRKKGVKIGENCVVFADVKFGSEPYLIEIGNNVRLTSNVKFVTHDGGMWVLRNLYKDTTIDKFGRIRIGDNVHVGWDVTIMPGVTIGSNCIIGVGAVVTKDIPDNSIAVGIPARVIETVNEYYEKSKSQFVNTHGMDRDAKRQFLLSLQEEK